MNTIPPHRLRSIASRIGISVAAILLVSVLTLLIYPDPIVNRYLLPKIRESFSTEYPGYVLRIAGIRCQLLKNRFEFDSVSVRSADDSTSAAARLIAVNGISWLRLLFGDNPVPDTYAQAEIEIHEILLAGLPAHYTVRCNYVRFSAADSQIIADDLQIYPGTDDESFFARDRYRQTRFYAVIPSMMINGVSPLSILQSEAYALRSVHIHHPQLNVLVNKDKKDRPASAAYEMPNAMLASQSARLKVDSVSISIGEVTYGERFGVRTDPAEITFDSMQMQALGISNRGTNPINISAQGRFMKSGTINIIMSIPVASPVFSLHYSGTVGSMNIGALNSFLETAEQVRVRGAIRSAAFDVEVIAGHARGTVRAHYSDLSVAFINAKTGSEQGIGDRITSFIANTFSIRKNNVPDKSGTLTAGRVDYALTRDDPFFRFVWFALRSGLKDIAGF